LEITSYGCEVRIFEWGVIRRGLCQGTTGYIKEGEEHKVLKLHKALYGLRQAPRAWNIKVDRTLKSLGFEKSPLEHAMYKRGQGRDHLLVGIYVDDLLITRADEKEIAKFKL
jgi:hypothetical protein